MTVSVLQERETSNGATAAPTITLAFLNPVTPGSSIHVICGSIDQASTTFACADSVNGSYGTAKDLINDTLGSDQFVMAQFVFDNTASGTPTITITPGASSGFLAVCIREIGGTSGYDGPNGHAAQQQSGPPGTGANAVSSGTATPSVQPGLISALSNDPSDTNAPTAGTGFTSGISGWQFGLGSPSMRTESKRYTATSAVAATFTGTSATDSYITFAAFFKESAAGSSFPPLPSIGLIDQRNNPVFRM